MKVPQSTGAAILRSTEEPPAAPRSPGPPCPAPALMPSAPHDQKAWGKTTRCPVSVSQTLSGQRRNEGRVATVNTV